MTYRRYPHPPIAHARALGVALLALLVLAIVAATTAGAATQPPLATTRLTASTTLVVNEIDYDQPGSDTDEFVELKNVSSSAINLDSYTVELVNGTGGGASVYKTVNLPNQSLAAGDYFVICGDSANVPNCDLDTTPDNGLVQNGAPDAVAVMLSGSVVDTVSYEGDTGSPYTEGSGSGLEDADSGDYDGVSRYPDGTDSDQNNSDLSLRCITPGEQNTSDNSNCPAPSGSATSTATSTQASATPDGSATVTPAASATATSGATASPASTATATALPTESPTPTLPASPTPMPPDTATPTPSTPETATATPTDAPPASVTPSSPPPPTGTATSAPGTATAEPLAVELIELGVSRDGQTAVVRWRTASEMKNAGFNVYRDVGDGLLMRVNDELIPGSGEPLAGASYRYDDRRAPLPAVDYWLEDIDVRGNAVRHGPVLAPPAAVQLLLAPPLYPRVPDLLLPGGSRPACR